MDWSVLGQIANKIAQTSTVTYTTEEVKVDVDVDGIEYIIGVGDTKTLTYDGAEYTARILGFNHDTIVNTTNKAGISFEFTSIPVTAVMNPAYSNEGGYEAMPLRTEMNSIYYNKIDSNVKGLIKTVGKEYIQTYNDASSVKTTTGDKLWILSCSEIFATGNKANAYGYAIAKEGNQYRYYAKMNPTYNSGNSNLVKQYSGSNQWYWLRSPHWYDSYYFCGVHTDGYCGNDCTIDTGGVAWYFSI